MSEVEENNETIIQFKEENTAETKVDEKGAFKEQDVHAIAGNITDTRVQQLLDREFASGKDTVCIDLSQIELTDTLVDQLKQQQKKFHEKGRTMKITGIDSAKLQEVGIKELNANDDVDVYSKENTGKAFEQTEEEPVSEAA